MGLQSQYDSRRLLPYRVISPRPSLIRRRTEPTRVPTSSALLPARFPMTEDVAISSDPPQTGTILVRVIRYGRRKCG